MSRSAVTRTALAIVLTLALQGCGKSEYERAKERFDFLKAHGASMEELCEEGKKVVSAAADERHKDYDLIAVTHKMDCDEVLLQRLRSR